MAIAIGVAAALLRGTLFDPLLMVLALIGVSAPVFWVGQVANMITQGGLHSTFLFSWVPPLGYTPFTQSPLLWFKGLTATYLPGWVFNVATIFHGEEAVLAAGFLFTVHFFNNHWRPDKFPLDIVMFTGAMPLEEFRREHQVEYNRLVASGELSKYLVDAPSQPLTRASKILGFTLMACGLILLAMVINGFSSHLFMG